MKPPKSSFHLRRPSWCRGCTSWGWWGTRPRFQGPTRSPCPCWPAYRSTSCTLLFTSISLWLKIVQVFFKKGSFGIQTGYQRVKTVRKAKKLAATFNKIDTKIKITFQLSKRRYGWVVKIEILGKIVDWMLINNHLSKVRRSNFEEIWENSFASPGCRWILQPDRSFCPPAHYETSSRVAISRNYGVKTIHTGIQNNWEIFFRRQRYQGDEYRYL